MIEPLHPLQYIPAQAAAVILETSREAELLGTLHPKQLEVVYAQNWFNLFVPKALGGLGLSLPEALNIEEGIAYADGSTGWTVTLCSGANWFAGFLHPETSSMVFGNKRVCLAGSGRSCGVAKITGEGYNVTGRWQYATGAPHATAFTANCTVEENGVVLANDDGSLLVYSFIFMRDEVAIHNDWHTTGMVATASHSFSVDGVYVPANRRFQIHPAHAALNNMVYQYPFLQFAETTLAVNASGMAVRFIDIFEPLHAARLQHNIFSAQAAKTITQKLSYARQHLHGARLQFYNAVQLSWQECATGKPESTVAIAEVSVKSRALAQAALHVVDALYPYCGMAVANPLTEINRVWRNLHTASQHSLLTPL